MELKEQLRRFDTICKLERGRIEDGYYKYKDNFLTDDLLTEMLEELLDLFGYIMLLKVRSEWKQTSKKSLSRLGKTQKEKA